MLGAPADGDGPRCSFIVPVKECAVGQSKQERNADKPARAAKAEGKGHAEARVL